MITTIEQVMNQREKLLEKLNQLDMENPSSKDEAAKLNVMANLLNQQEESIKYLNWLKERGVTKSLKENYQ